MVKKKKKVQRHAIKPLSENHKNSTGSSKSILLQQRQTQPPASAQRRFEWLPWNLPAILMSNHSPDTVYVGKVYSLAAVQFFNWLSAY